MKTKNKNSTKETLGGISYFINWLEESLPTVLGIVFFLGVVITAIRQMF